MSNYTLHLGDCLEIMPGIPDGSVDAIIADWPYGTTACSWDSVIPLEPLWIECKRVIKPKGVIVLTASQPFTSVLVMSNLSWFKYEWIWDKVVPSNFQLANYQPMKNHESILVFGNAPAVFTKKGDSLAYYPQMIELTKENVRPKKDGWNTFNMVRIRSGKRIHKTPEGVGFPRSIIQINKNNSECNPTSKLHSNQKPVALMEYLIKTYTNPGELILDNTMGSGSTGEAAIRTGRRFIGIEKDPDYFRIAQERLQRVEEELRQPSQLELV